MRRHLATASLLALVLLLGGLGVTIGAAATPAAAVASLCDTIDPFTDDDRAQLDELFAGREIAAAVRDLSTGCQFHYGVTDVFPTASTVKLQIMGAVFLALQDQGLTSMPAWMGPLMTAMIEWSDNDSADTLDQWLGGGGALQAYGRRLGMVTTDNADHSWGGDATTPDDQLALLSAVVVGGGPLASRWVGLARQLLTAVDSSQRWGVTAGTPTGTTVWVKNGWLYNDGTMWGPADAWRLGSVGVVQLPNGRRYAIAVYDDDSSLMTDGVGAIETIAAHVAVVMNRERADAVGATTMSTQTVASVVTVFEPHDPVRLVDTRLTGNRVVPASELVVDVPAAEGTDGATVAAVALEVTAVDPAADGYVTVYADGTTRPLASDLNPLAGRVTANLVVAPVGADGRVRLFSSTAVDLVVDLVGTFVAHDGTATAGRIVGVEPVRVLDSRATQAVAAGSVTRVAVVGVGAVPAKGVAAVAVTVTATDIAQGGYWTVWPGDGALPLASVLSAGVGDTVGNTTLVPVAADGTIAVYSQNGGQLVVDVVGWVTDASAAPATTGRTAVLAEPVRIVDTRIGVGADRLVGDEAATLALGSIAGGAHAIGLLANLTTVDPEADGFVTVYPGGSPPATSTTNPSPARDPAAAAVVTGVAADSFAARSKAPVDLVVDAWAWLTA